MWTVEFDKDIDRSEVVASIIKSQNNRCVPFEDMDVPHNRLVTANIQKCKGFAHVDPAPRRMPGFMFPNAMNIEEEEIFRDYDALCNELSSRLTPSSL